MNFGIYYIENNCKHYICSCGFNNTVYNENDNKFYKCNCGNDFFKEVSPKYHGGKITSKECFQILDQGNWGFICEKYKYIAYYNKSKNSIVDVKKESSILSFDFRNDNFYIETNGNKYYYNKPPIELEQNYNVLRKWFNGQSNERLIFNSINKNIQSQLKACKYIGWYENENVENRLYRLIVKLSHKKYINILGNINVPCDGLTILAYKPDGIDTTKTKPHEILGIPKYTLKYMIPYIEDVYGWYIDDIKLVQQFLYTLNKDNIKYMFEKANEEISTELRYGFKYVLRNENFHRLANIYKHSFNRLIDYLFRDVKLEQGIIEPKDAIVLLYDYIRMCKLMDIDYEKYPKSLKKVHDVTTMNFRVKEDEYKIKEFKVRADEYKDLEYKDKNCSIIIPQTPTDLINEGKGLSHCVASYVDDVIHEKCKILLMRKNEEINKPYITIEIRNNNLRQYRGFANREPNENEMKFIHKWCDEKNIQYVA